MRTSHWHGGVKVTASSGGGSAAATLFALLVAVGGAIAFVELVPWEAIGEVLNVVLTCALVVGVASVPARMLVRHWRLERALDRAAEGTEDRYRAHARTLEPVREPVREPVELEAPVVIDLDPSAWTSRPWDREPVDLEGRWSA